MLTQRSVGVGKDYTLILKILLHAVIDNLRFVLCRNAGKELLFRFRDTQLVEGLFNLGRHFLPSLSLFLRWSYIVLDIVKIQLIEIAAPFRHRHFVELLQSFQTEFQHPLRFVLDGGDFFNNFGRKSLTRLEYRLMLVTEPILVLFHIRRFLSHGVSLLVFNVADDALLPRLCLCAARSMRVSHI
ncbi:hypothetical protein D3C75_806120 [compost metagenome]